MARHARSALVVALALAAGCVAGEPRYFDDQSEDVRSLRVNAYHDVENGVAVVEVRALGADGLERAFKGDLRVGLDRLDRSSEPHRYIAYKAWRDEVTADDFASPTVPTYVLRVAAKDMLHVTTYRAWANATIGDQLFAADPAPFDWSG